MTSRRVRKHADSVQSAFWRGEERESTLGKTLEVSSSSSSSAKGDTHRELILGNKGRLSQAGLSLHFISNRDQRRDFAQRIGVTEAVCFRKKKAPSEQDRSARETLDTKESHKGYCNNPGTGN